MYLKGPIYKWFESTLKDYLESVETREEAIDLIFGSWAQFEITLNRIFGLINEERIAVRTIYRVKQKGSAAQYYS